MNNILKQYLNSFNLLNEDDLALLDGQTYERSIAKNDFLTREGEISKEVAFVNSGHFRSFYFSSTGEEVTYCFLLPHTFISAYASFINQKRSQESIQALSDAQLTCISRDVLLNLEDKSKNWLKLSKQIAEQEYLNLEKRVFLLQKETAEKRYEDLIQNRPELLQMVSLEQLASYLGVSQRHLSRIRGSIAN